MEHFRISIEVFNIREIQFSRFQNTVPTFTMTSSYFLIKSKLSSDSYKEKVVCGEHTTMNKIKFVGGKNAPRRLLKTVCLSVSRSNRCIDEVCELFLFLLLAQHTVTVVTIVALLATNGQQSHVPRIRTQLNA